MAIPKPVIAFLAKNAPHYQIVRHRKVFTALDKSATLHEDPRRVVKTVVLLAQGRRTCLALVPASYRIEKPRLIALLNRWFDQHGQNKTKTIQFATERWLKGHIIGQIGAAPPFAALFKMPACIDRAIGAQRRLYLNTGDYQYSFLASGTAFRKIIGDWGIFGSFAKKAPSRA